jgi:hypothetical protein
VVVCGVLALGGLWCWRKAFKAPVD